MQLLQGLLSIQDLAFHNNRIHRHYLDVLNRLWPTNHPLPILHQLALMERGLRTATSPELAYAYGCACLCRISALPCPEDK